MTDQKDNNGFHVHLEGIELSHEAKERIQNGIQALVLKEIAAYKPNPDDPEPRLTPNGVGTIIVPPRWWWGFILRAIGAKEETINMKELNKLANSKTFGSV